MAVSHLDRLTLAAGGGGKYLPRSAENPLDSDEDLVNEAHEHLRHQCPWYAKASAGAPVADFKQHCEPADDEGEVPRLVVKFAADGGELLFTERTPIASTVPEPTGRPGGPGLWHVKGMQLPPYIQHLYKHLVGRYGREHAYGVAKGIVAKWAAGIRPGGKKPGRVHADVQAAAQKNIGQWEEKRARARSEGGRDHVRATMELASPVITAPGAMYDVVPPTPGGKYAQYGLHQRPSATVSPSPPLPPKVPLPTPKEVRSLIPEVPVSADVQLSNTVKSFLETAAVKLERNHQLDALTMLRAAGHAIIPAHKADIARAMPALYTANVFGRVPPAGQSSAHSEMMQSREQTQEWRKLERHVQALADRIRKRYFHGVYQGPSQMARMTEVTGALDKVMELASPAAHEVSFPTESDTSRRTIAITPPAGLAGPGGKAREELSGLSPLDKVRVSSYLDAARSAKAEEDHYTARQLLSRAHEAAKAAGAHHLAAYLAQLNLSLQGGLNSLK